jgi:amino acid transporter
LDHTQPDPATVAALTAYSGVALIFVLAFFVFTIFIYWRIASKAGYNGAASLLLLIPLVNLIMICIFAFSEWPIERALKVARGEAGPPQWTPPPTPYQPPSVS